jgi:dimethylhistidine N-methyltransferase
MQPRSESSILLMQTATLPPVDDDFRDHVLWGLGLERKRLDSKYFYDAAGSALYDEICNLPEYYPFRAELAILPEVARELRADAVSEIVEFGAGSLLKVKVLLSGIGAVRRYLPIDISAAHLTAACRQLRAGFAALGVHPVAEDFTRLPGLPENPGPGSRLGFFPGSTIGNFGPEAAARLLREFRDLLGAGARLLIGVDCKKDAGLLHRAYNDSQGVTARFNLNLLHRINRELAADFDPENFEHYAFYNPAPGRVEMHLVSRIRQQARVAGRVFGFERGESIHTENSYKYSRAEFESLAGISGWEIARSWTDPDARFAVYLMRGRAQELRPDRPLQAFDALPSWTNESTVQ